MVNANELLLHDLSLYVIKIFASTKKFLCPHFLRISISKNETKALQHCFLMLFELMPQLYVSSRRSQ